MPAAERRKETDEETEGQPDGSFRSMHARTSGGTDGLWAKKEGGKGKKKRVRHLRLVEPSADDLPRALEIDVLSEWLDITDYIFPGLDSKERTVFTIFWRNSRGAGRATCFMKLPEIHALAGGMSLSGVQYAINRLCEMGLVCKKSTVTGRGKDQGVEYELKLPRRFRR